MIEGLKNLLLRIKDSKPENFSGLGIVFYKNLQSLPISPLRERRYLDKMPITDVNLVYRYLVEVSTYSSIWHDGFHLISSDFHLTHFCQYFSTPIIGSAPIEYNYGSRHRTALYGSYIDGVIACGVINSDFNSTIFQRGKKMVL